LIPRAGQEKQTPNYNCPKRAISLRPDAAFLSFPKLRGAKEKIDHSQMTSHFPSQWSRLSGKQPFKHLRSLPAPVPTLA
ncbi:MAG: hypothetical protein K2K82_07555, partial [Muribaculaceae bacterium]|nr:hypothetical protein [Muribaculaceae bacterium]